MKSTVKNKMVLGVALSAAFAPTRFIVENAIALPIGAATQGEISTPFSKLDSPTDSAFSPQETGFEPFFPFSVGTPNAPFDAAGNCPTGNCPFVPPSSPRVSSDVQVAIRSVARVYNSYRETISATGGAAGTMRRDVIEKGSGAFVADLNGAICVLTAAHIFRDGRGTISVESVDGRKFSATLELASDEYDVALLRLDDASADVPTLRVSQSWPKQGDRIWRAGFGPNETLKTSTGVVKGYVKTSRNDTYETLKISGSARQGDSGGPICDESGEIVGVLWGTDGSDVYATYSARILKTLSDSSSAFRAVAADESFAEKELETPETPIDSRLAAARPSSDSDPSVANPSDRFRSAVLERADAARAAFVEREARRSLETTFQHWSRLFWNVALAVALFLAGGYGGFLKAKKASPL